MKITEKRHIAYLDTNQEGLNKFSSLLSDQFEIQFFENAPGFYEWCKNGGKADAVVSSTELNAPHGLPLLRALRAEGIQNRMPFVMIVDRITDKKRQLCLQEGVSDLFEYPLNKDAISTRVSFLIENHQDSKQSTESIQPFQYKMPLLKRIFDIVFASMALLCLSPLFLIIAALIKLESKGPVIYYSLRAGTGYKIFKFYKFRSMIVNADAKLKDLKHLNQYAQNEEPKAEQPAKVRFLCDECKMSNTGCQQTLFADGEMICEKLHHQAKKQKAGAAFLKISNDPRITRIGKFIRNSSIDELPQLFNVLIGDMSIVGNRPLPLYEAEKLTTDQFALRFLAPAGITGLWQVTKRGKGGPMSEEERIGLDNDYARNYSFWRDIKIILQTIPALFQKENV